MQAGRSLSGLVDREDTSAENQNSKLQTPKKLYRSRTQQIPRNTDFVRFSLPGSSRARVVQCADLPELSKNMGMRSDTQGLM